MGKNGLPPRPLPGSFAAKAKQMAVRASERVAQRGPSPDRKQARMPDTNPESSGGVEVEDIPQFEPLYTAPSTASAPVEAQQSPCPRPAIAVPSGSSRLQSELQQSRNLQREIWARESEPNSPPPQELPPQPYYPPQAFASAPGHASPYDQAPRPAQPPTHQSMGGQYPQPVHSHPGPRTPAWPDSDYPRSARTMPEPISSVPDSSPVELDFKPTPAPAHCIGAQPLADVKQTTGEALPPNPGMLDWLDGSNSPNFVRASGGPSGHLPVGGGQENPPAAPYYPQHQSVYPPAYPTDHGAMPPAPSAYSAAGPALPRGWKAVSVRQPNGELSTMYEGVGRDRSGQQVRWAQYAFPIYPLD
jgi:hypothetical protein